MVFIGDAQGDDSITLEQFRLIAKQGSFDFTATIEPEPFGSKFQRTCFYVFPATARIASDAIQKSEDLDCNLMCQVGYRFTPAYSLNHTGVFWTGRPSSLRVGNSDTAKAIERLVKSTVYKGVLKDGKIAITAMQVRRITGGSARGLAYDFFFEVSALKGVAYERVQLLPNGPVHFCGRVHSWPMEFGRIDLF